MCILRSLCVYYDLYVCTTISMCILRSLCVYYDLSEFNTNLLIAGLVPDDFRCHPGDSSGKAHARRMLPTPSPACAEVADLDDLVAADEDAAEKGH